MIIFRKVPVFKAVEVIIWWFNDQVWLLIYGLDIAELTNQMSIDSYIKLHRAVNKLKSNTYFHCLVHKN